MNRGRRLTTLLSLSGLLVAGAACQGRELIVFELGAGGSAWGGGGSDSGNGGGGGVVSAGSAGAGGGGTSSDGVSGASPSAGTGAGTGAEAGAGARAGAGTGGTADGIPCISNLDCGQGWFCEKESCDAQTGLCDLRPTRPTLDFAPVCGCDGVTYWNDIARRQFGTVMRQPDQCSTDARPCNVGTDCIVPFASCARLVSRAESCGPPTQGACWLLPPDCPPFGVDPVLWQECRPPDQSGTLPPCVDTCRAIRSEHPHQQPRDLKMCPM